MRLLVVIVNWRTVELTVDALASVADEVQLLGDAHVVVADNDSGGEVVARLADAVRDRGWNAWCEVKPLPRNGGFAYGNNEAIRPYLGDAGLRYVLLLNPDTVARPGAIGRLVEFMERIQEWASPVRDSKILTERRSATAFRFPTAISEFEHGLRFGAVSRLLERYVVAPPVPDNLVQTDWVAGASMILRREMIDQIGLLDEGYFMYYEEVDYCLRARRAGWTCMYVPQSRVVHLVGQASGVTGKGGATRRLPAYWFESRRRYFVRNHGRLYAILADAAFAVSFGVWRVRRRLQRKPDADPAHLLRDLLRHSALLRGLS